MDRSLLGVISLCVLWAQTSAVNLECGSTFGDLGDFCGISHVVVEDQINFTDANLQNFHTLKFYSSNVPIFPREIFSQFPQLKELFMKRNNVSVIPPKSFMEANTLEVVDLGSNTITKLETDFLLGASNLKTLRMEHCSLTVVEKDAFRYLPSLKNLYLGFNELKELDRQTFATLPSLSVVHLYYNALSEVDPFTFAQNDKLVDVDLEGNSLREVDLWFSSSSLDLVDLSHNQLVEVSLRFDPESFVISSPHVDLSRNLIRSVFIDPRLSPSSLSLEDNNLSSAANLTALTSLTKLLLSDNPLKNFSSIDLSNLSELTLLHLDRCSLGVQNIPPTLRSLRNLKTLNLAANSLGHFSADWINECESLEELEISDNLMLDFDYQKLKLPHLKMIYLSGNSFDCGLLRDMIGHFSNRQVRTGSSSLLNFIFGNPRTSINGIDCENGTSEASTPPPIFEKSVEQKILTALDEVLDQETDIAETSVLLQKVEHREAQLELDVSIIKVLVVILVVLSGSKLIYSFLTHLQAMQRKITPTYIPFTDMKSTSQEGHCEESCSVY